MNNPHADLLYRAYDAFGEGDFPTALNAFADDITWHVPGRSPLTRDPCVADR